MHLRLICNAVVIRANADAKKYFMVALYKGFLHKKQIFLFSDPSECLEVLHFMLNVLDLRLPNLTERFAELTKRLMLKILEERFKVGLKNENYFS